MPDSKRPEGNPPRGAPSEAAQPTSRAPDTGSRLSESPWPEIRVRIPVVPGIEDAVRSFESFGRVLSGYVNAARPSIVALGEMTARYAGMLAAAVEGLTKAGEEVFGAAEKLGRLGWTMPMNATLPECRALLDAATDSETLNGAFDTFYFERGSQHLDELWTETITSPVLERWKPMLTEARAAFNQQLYLVTVAALLPVLDGLAHRAWDLQFHKKDRRDRFFQKKIAEAQATTVTSSLWRSTHAFVDAVFGYADFNKDDAPEVLNRHWILHGLALPSGNRVDCVRVLQAIHSFEDLVRDAR